MRSFLSPNCSYDALIEEYKYKLEKNSPYDWLNNCDIVNNTELLSHEVFFNRMKTKILYSICVNAWKH